MLKTEPLEIEMLLGFFIFSAVAAYILLFLRRTKAASQKPTPTLRQSPIPWEEQLLQELNFLEGSFHQEQPKEAMARFSALVDAYVQKKYHLEASFLTTTETVQKLNSSTHREEIQNITLLLQESDQVKFAKQEKAEEAWQLLFTTFRKILGFPSRKTKDNLLTGAAHD
jgi:hypothetical protein